MNGARRLLYVLPGGGLGVSAAPVQLVEAGLRVRVSVQVCVAPSQVRVVKFGLDDTSCSADKLRGPCVRAGDYWNVENDEEDDCAARNTLQCRTGFGLENDEKHIARRAPSNVATGYAHK